MQTDEIKTGCKGKLLNNTIVFAVTTRKVVK